MSYLGLGLAALGGMVASFAVGFLSMWLVPALFDESRKYPDVFRTKDGMMAVMPIGLAATFISHLIAAVFFSLMARDGSSLVDGLRFGVLVGAFVIFAFVLHNYVNLKIGLRLALAQAAAYFVQWLVVGTVIGTVYRFLANS